MPLEQDISFVQTTARNSEDKYSESGYEGSKYGENKYDKKTPDYSGKTGEEKTEKGAEKPKEK